MVAIAGIMMMRGLMNRMLNRVAGVLLDPDDISPFFVLIHSSALCSFSIYDENWHFGSDGREEKKISRISMFLYSDNVICVLN